MKAIYTARNINLAIALIFIFNFCTGYHSSAQVPAYIPTSGLQGWYPFTGNANDSSGYANHGTPYGSVTYGRDYFGNSNSSYVGNGSTGINIPFVNLPTGNNSRSVSTWYKSVLPYPGSLRELMAWGNNTALGQRFGLYTNGTVIGLEYLNGAVTTSFPHDSNWHNLIVTYPSSGAGSSSVKLYFDGILQSTTTTTPVSSFATDTGFIHTIGTLFLPSSSLYSWVGSLDDVGIWNRALSGCEAWSIAHHSVASTGGTIVDNTTGCVGFTLSLSDTGGVAGGTWSSSTTSVATVNTSGTLFGLAAGTTIVTYTSLYGCYDTAVITISARPGIGAISGPSTVCSGASIALSDTVTGGRWACSDTTIATINPSTGVATGIRLGSVDMMYVVSNSCGSDTAHHAVTILSVPIVGSISGAAGVCPGGSVVLTDTSAGGIWSSSNTALATVHATTGLVTGIAAGSVVMRYVLANTCGADTAYHSLVVYSNPFAGNISGSSIVCVGTNITLTDTVTGGVWSSDNLSLATVSPTGVVTGLAPGTVVISYAVTNSCGTLYVTDTITVATQPYAGTISGLSAVCAGSSIVLSASVSGGTWSATNSNSTVTGTGTVNGVTSGVDTISYRVANYCGADTAHYVIAIDPLPSNIAGVAPICAGSNTLALTDTTVGGVWTSSNLSIVTVSTTGIVTSVGVGTVVIRYTLPATGCYVVATVVVNALPAAIVGAANVCLGSGITLTDATGGGLWSSNNTSVASVDATGNVTGIATGPVVITYTLVSTGCYITHDIDVLGVPSPISGPSTICVGGAIVLTDSTAGGAWTTSNAAVASVNTTGVVTGVSVGTATITYTNGGCYRVLTITVGSTLPSISGPSAVCEGATVTLSNAVTGGAWSSSNTGIATINATGNTTGVLPGSATISYTTGPGCVSTMPFTVNAIPVAITGTTTLCAGGSTTTLADATSGGSWSTSNPAIASVNSATGVVTGVTAGTATITYDRFGCYVTTTVTVNPQAASVITPIGDTTMCPGDFVILTAPTSSAYTYQWYNVGAPIIGATSSIYTTYTAGNYRLAIVNSYGCLSSSAPMAVTVNAVTATATAAGPTTICGGSTVAINASTGAGLTYQWVLGGVGISGATSATYAAGASGSYNVIISNAAGCSGASAPVTVTVLPAPPTTITVTGALSFCNGGSVALAATAGSALTYQWQVGGVDIAGATNINYTATGTGNYRVVVANGYPCTAASTVAAVTVMALPSANITVTGSPTFCGGGSVPLNTVASAGNSYQWIFNGTPVTGATTASYTATTGGSYAVKVIAPTGCINTTTPAQVLTEMATPYIVPLTSTAHCWGSNSLLAAHTSTTTGIAYQWQFNGTNIAGATNSTYGAGPSGYYSCIISLVAIGCTSSSPSMGITEWPAPNPVVTYDGTHLNTGATFATYQWFKAMIPIAGATNASVTPTSTGYYEVQVSDANGCLAFSPSYPLKSLVLDTIHTDSTHHSGSGTGTTGVTTLNHDEVKIFPNPAQSTIHIVASMPLRAVMTAIDGRKVIDEANAHTLNISQLASGMYMLMLFDKDGVMVKNEKVVKE